MNTSKSHTNSDDLEINTIPKTQDSEIKEPYCISREINGMEPEYQQATDNGFVRFRYKDDSAVVIDTFNRKIHEIDCNNKLIKTKDIESELDVKLLKRSLAVLNGDF